MILGSGLFALVVAVTTWFDAGTSSDTSWVSSPLFAYAALLGFAAPPLVVLARLLGRRLPVTVFGVPWPRLLLATAGVAVVNTVAVLVVGQESTGGVVVAGLAALGIAAGAVLLSRERA